MPDMRISELDEAETITGQELVEVVQDGQNKRALISQIQGGGGGTDYPQLTETTTARTLSLADAGSFLYCTNVAGCAITVPPQSSVAWAANTTILGVGKLGNTTFVGGGGVSIIRPSDRELECYDGAPWALRRTAENEWLLTGYLVETV